MAEQLRLRRTVAIGLVLIFVSITILISPQFRSTTVVEDENNSSRGTAYELLGKLSIKGRAPKTGYERAQFGNGWAVNEGCDTRNIILNRDLEDNVVNEKCQVVSGVLDDPYTGKLISFQRGADSSAEVQIDHVVALSDAWQKGAQQISYQDRITFANDPLNLLAVDGEANQEKSDGDAATWLPPNVSFRCQYVARQIAVKYKYSLWVTQAEYDAMKSILQSCPAQDIPKNSIENIVAT